MPDTKHPKCQHPKCGAKMQRIYKRDHATFIPCGWDVYGLRHDAERQPHRFDAEHDRRVSWVKHHGIEKKAVL